MTAQYIVSSFRVYWLPHSCAYSKLNGRPLLHKYTRSKRLPVVPPDNANVPAQTAPPNAATWDVTYHQMRISNQLHRASGVARITNKCTQVSGRSRFFRKNRQYRQGCGIGDEMSDSDSNSGLYKISHSENDSRLRFCLLRITWVKFSCQQFCSNKQSTKIEVLLTRLSLCNTQARAVTLWNEQSITKHWFQSVRTCPYSWATGRNSTK